MINNNEPKNFSPLLYKKDATCNLLAPKNKITPSKTKVIALYNV
jgi:hypothetical protein